MALHFLDHGFQLPDDRTPGLHHGLELYEQGGQRYLRVWIGGEAADMPLLCRLTKADAQRIAEAAEALAHRIAD